MSKYLAQAQNFLRITGTEMRITYIRTVKGFPNDPADKQTRKKYNVCMTRGEKSYDFSFYGSHADYLAGKKPTAYDVLACIEKYEYPTDPWEFAQEFGYEINCEKDYNRVRKIAEECREQYEKLCWLFDGEIPEELCEIN